MKHLLMDVSCNESIPFHYYYQKALELGLKGELELKGQHIHVDVHGVENAIHEMVKLLLTLPSYEIVTMTIDTTYQQLDTLTSNLI